MSEYDELWIEKYRPAELAEVGLEDETRRQLEGYIESGEIPHLLLAGPPGCGKTTVARILCRSLDAEVLTLNASSERGIDVIRGKVKQFSTGKMLSRWNIIFLDEADQLTPDAQASLRNTMETYADRARFILTANWPNRIIDAIQSRCVSVPLGGIPWEERFRILTRVLDLEGIAYEPKTALSYANAYSDMRRVLQKAQACVRRKGFLDMHGGEGGIDGPGIIALIDQARSEGLKAVRRRLLSLSRDGTIDHVLLVRQAVWAVSEDRADGIALMSALYSWWKDLQSFEVPTVFVGGFVEVVEALSA